MNKEHQETIDLVYTRVADTGVWPEALSIAQTLLTAYKIELRHVLQDADWLFLIDDVSTFSGSIKLTSAGICLASAVEAREDLTHILRFVRAIGRIASSRMKHAVSSKSIAEEMGEDLSPHRLLLSEATLTDLGFSIRRSSKPRRWSVAWDVKLSALRDIEDADTLLKQILGINIADHQARYHPATFAIPAPSSRDRRLFAELLIRLPFEGSIRFAHENNIAGFSFDYSRFGDFEAFERYWQDAMHRFQHPLLERGRRTLHVIISRYLRYISNWTFPTNAGWQTVPPEWEYEQPIRFRRVVDELHRMAGEIVHYHQELVSLGTMLLGSES